MPKTLLLADDSVTIQKVVGISFANEDVVLVTVDNGDDAVVRARETRPDLVLADVAMPGKDGYAVCEAIKADPELRHVPVLLLSGTFESFDEERARHVGADGHITKPFEAQALVDRVNELLAHAEAARPVGGSDTTVLVSERPAVTGDAFDFFDEEFSQTAPAARATAAPAALDTDDDESFSGMPIELEAAGDEDLSMPPEAIAVTSFDEEAVSSPDEGHATILFDAPQSNVLRVSEASFDASELASAPLLWAPPAGAATQLLASEAAPDAVPPALPAANLDDAFDFGFEDEVEPIEAPVAPRETPLPEIALEAESYAEQDLFESELDAPVTPPPVPVLPTSQPPATEGAVASTAHVEALRQEMRQHLEKVAWEAFGDLSERIVRETLARIEAIAWEVIPQMAETLIREEIRKLHDDDE